mgnify:CR=1 FL=1
MLPLLLACSSTSSDSAAPADPAALDCGTDSPTQQSVTVSGLSMNVACQGEGETVLMPVSYIHLRAHET